MAQVNLKNLRDSPIFEGLSSDEKDHLAEFFVVKQVAAGKTIYIENMAGENLYLISSGAISISQMIGEVDEETLVILRSGETFGELAMIDEGLRAVTARVVEEAELYLLSRTEFNQLATANPSLGMRLTHNLFRIFSKRLRQAKSDYRDMLLATLERKKQQSDD